MSDIVAAAGMELADLFRIVRKIAHRSAVVNGGCRATCYEPLAGEVTIAVLAAEDLARGRPLSERDHARLTQAYARLRAAAAEV